MFDNARSAWLPKGEPFNGPALQPWRIENIIIHYIGTERAPRDSAQWMLNEHKRTMSRPALYAFMHNGYVGLDGTTLANMIDHAGFANPAVAGYFSTGMNATVYK
jgi:hypothetical protein